MAKAEMYKKVKDVVTIIKTAKILILSSLTNFSQIDDILETSWNNLESKWFAQM
jgi:hypothetical protein